MIPADERERHERALAWFNRQATPGDFQTTLDEAERVQFLDDVCFTASWRGDEDWTALDHARQAAEHFAAVEALLDSWDAPLADVARWNGEVHAEIARCLAYGVSPGFRRAPCTGRSGNRPDTLMAVFANSGDRASWSLVLRRAFGWRYLFEFKDSHGYGLSAAGPSAEFRWEKVPKSLRES